MVITSRFLLSAILFSVLASWANARTYTFDYQLGAASGGTSFDYDTETDLNEDVAVTGVIKTDGTLGAISEANILSWAFTLTGPEDKIAISSQMLFGNSLDVRADMFASETSLSAFDYMFGEELELVDSDGVYTYRQGWIQGGIDADGVASDYVKIYGFVREGTDGAFREGNFPIPPYGEVFSYVDAFAPEKFSDGPRFIGTVQPSPPPGCIPSNFTPPKCEPFRPAVVPLPAGLPLLLAGLGGLVFLRKRHH